MKNAPNFSLSNQHGKLCSLADYAGKWLVLYFYPQDETPGCTKEACSFRDGRDLLIEQGAEVVGISQDSVASHKAFTTNHKLNFTLLSDESAIVARAYNSLGDDGWTQRKTFLINPSGQIAKEYSNVNPTEHVAELLTDLHNLASGHA